MRTMLAGVIASVVAVVLPAVAQSRSEAGKELRIVGCVQWEKDYRRGFGDLPRIKMTAWVPVTESCATP